MVNSNRSASQHTRAAFCRDAKQSFRECCAQAMTPRPGEEFRPSVCDVSHCAQPAGVPSAPAKKAEMRKWFLGSVLKKRGILADESRVAVRWSVYSCRSLEGWAPRVLKLGTWLLTLEGVIMLLFPRWGSSGFRTTGFEKSLGARKIAKS